MSERDVLMWRKRRTVGWLSLSLAARGAIEGVVCSFDERGELRLGRAGLPGLAVVLGRPWAEVEPAILEALEAGKLELDEERQVLFDPQHRERQGLEELHRELAEPQVVNGPPPASSRGSSTERSRRHRAVKRFQLLLPGTDATDATVQRVASVASSAPAPESQAPITTSVPHLQRCLKVASNSPSLSDLKDLSSKKRKGATSRDVVQRDATLPDDLRGVFVDACAAAGVDVAADFVWRKFTPHAHSKRWRVHEVADRWRTWTDREITWTLQKAAREERASRPGLASSASTLADRERWERDAQASRPARVAAAAAAMAMFA